MSEAAVIVRGAIDRAIRAVGGVKPLADAINVSASAPAMWRSRASVPAAHCAQIEMATGKSVLRSDLRPLDWHLIWPELVGTEGAPRLEKASEAARAG